MPWKQMRLRDSLVFVRVDETGTPIEQRGRVEVRYKLGSDKAYHAGVRNLSASSSTTLLSDDSFPAGVAAAPSATSKTKSSTSTSAPTTPTSSTNTQDNIIAYADGACSGNPGPSGLGLVVIHANERLERSEYLGHGTNNIAELTAILRAVEAGLPNEKPLVIHTDSQYSIGVLTKGWKPKANQELIATLKQRVAARGGVRFVYVPGHAGVPLNERADALARQAVETRKTAESRFPMRVVANDA